MFDKVLTSVSLDLEDQQVEVIKDRRSEIIDKDLNDLNLSTILDSDDSDSSCDWHNFEKPIIHFKLIIWKLSQ